MTLKISATAVQERGYRLTNDDKIRGILSLYFLVLCNDIDILAFDFGELLYGQILNAVC